MSHGLSFLPFSEVVVSASNAADAEDNGAAGWGILWDSGAGEPVFVLSFSSSVQGHARTQEGDGVQVAEADGDASIQAKGSHRTKGRAAAQEESQGVGQGGNGHGDGGVPVGVSQPVSHVVQDRGPLPAGDHDEHVIQANTWDLMGG